MRRTKPRVYLLIVPVVLAFSAVMVAAQSPPGAIEWVCPPCGSDCHDAVYAAAGVCPICAMQLVDKRRVDAGDLRQHNVGILIFDGVQIIDYTGPYEVFGQAGYNTFTVAKDRKAITTAMGMSVNPNYEFGNCPELDIMVIPGGDVHDVETDGAVSKWIRDSSIAADYVLSVCNGAFILAATGLLDSLSATTYHGLIDELRDAAPTVNVVSDQRFVDNGKLITSAGLSSGIDASLHVVSKINGKGRAQSVALNMEYDWRPDSGYARAALADRYLHGLANPGGFDWKLLSTEGDRDGWVMKMMVETDLSAEAALEKVGATLSTDGGWKRVDVHKSRGLISSQWTFNGDGGKWNGVAAIAHMGSESSTYLLTLEISRAGAK